MKCVSLHIVYRGLPCLKALNKESIQRILIIYFKPNPRSHGEKEKGHFDSNPRFQFTSTGLQKPEQIQPQSSTLKHSTCTKIWTPLAWFCIYTSRPKVSLYTYGTTTDRVNKGLCCFKNVLTEVLQKHLH